MPPTSAAPQVGSYVGYTGQNANIVATAAHDPMYGPAVRRKRFSSICRLCGLASMYPASDWSGAPGNHGYQRACVLIRALRRLQRESKPSPWIFITERGSPFTTAGFAKMIERAARPWSWARTEGSPAHASPRLWLCARQQRAGYQGNPGMVGAPFDHVDGGLYGAGAESVQGFLAGVSAECPVCDTLTESLSSATFRPTECLICRA